MDFEELLKQIKDELLKVLGESYADYKTESKKDVEAFLEASKEKLERWTKLLANTELTVKDYEWLLKSQKDLVTLKALQTVGISKIRLNNIKNSILKTIFDIVLAAVIK